MLGGPIVSNEVCSCLGSSILLLIDSIGVLCWWRHRQRMLEPSRTLASMSPSVPGKKGFFVGDLVGGPPLNKDGGVGEGCWR